MDERAVFSADTSNGMWSDDPNLRGNYLFASTHYTGGSWQGCDTNGCITYYGAACSGCSCTKDRANVTDCAGSSIEILDCLSFSRIANGTFDQLTSLNHLVIQFTAIDRFPDISKTAMQILGYSSRNLAQNKIELNTLTYTEQVLPSTLTHVALMNNAIYWLPPGMFSNSNVRILSLSNNQIVFFPTEAVKNMPNLLYLGLDGNRMKAISRANMEALSTSQIQHLNISNNNIFFIEQHTLSKVPELKILELHRNKLVNIPAYTFDGIAKLLHLELNKNQLKTLGTASFTNLPELVTLILHSQDPGLEVIQYDAFRDIGSKLENLWVSDNSLPVFPHQVLAEGSYPSLTIIYADNNNIVDPTDLGKESYMRQKEGFIPFATTTNMQALFLGTNQIKQVQEKDFCKMSHLRELYLESNQLSEKTIHPESLRCLGELQILFLDNNQCQYVPEAVTTAERVPSLNTLSLGGNHLTSLLQGTFNSISTLTELDLQSNQFRFQHEHPFANLPHLSTLFLGSNQITVIPDTAFHNLTSLTTLDLSSNRLTELPNGGDFQDLHVYKDLSLNSNRLTFLQTGIFTNTQCEYL
ncbi:hypothetical protein LSAT2_006946 [Lamellibrachia satsuma]|nr:hypothetical protein LSAT2_006946 [Lamellibrachia satsuma]